MSMEYKEFYRRKLPHFQPEDSVFSITFRLAFSLPGEVLEDLKYKKSYLTKSTTGNEKPTKENSAEVNWINFCKMDELLAKYKKSPRWLESSEMAQIIIDSLQFYNEKRYMLIAYCIMPNHVHLILQPLKNEYDSYYLLAEIMSSIKSYTARRCNEVLKRNGQFWEYESYDHAIRDDLDFSRQLYYLVNNPVKAGYVNDYSDWQYTWVCESYREEM